MIDNSFLKRISNLNTHNLLSLTCCLIAVLGGLLFPSSSHALRQGDEIVMKKWDTGLNVREDPHIPPEDPDDNVKTTVKFGTKGVVQRGPVQGPTYTWYEIAWETSVTGWSAEVIDGCKTIITTERAMQKDELVAKLFDLDLHEVDAKTYHDYNDYGCNLNWAPNGKRVYQGGHAGWDVQTRDKSLNQSFHSLTAGEFIRAGNDSYNTIAVYNPTDDKTTLYLHASEILVSIEDNPMVEIGQPLGKQGKMGNATGVHVHIEVREGKWGQASAGARGSQNTNHPNVDPIPYLFQSISTSTDASVDPDPDPIRSLHEGHTGRVNSVAFSPDGRTIVSGSDDETVRIWDASTGEHKRILVEHTRDVNGVAFSPDGRTIATGSDDDNIHLWDAITGKHMQTLERHTDRINSVAFSPDGRTIVSGSDDETVRIWDAITGKHKQTLEGHTRNVNSVAFSPDGRTIVSGSDDETVRIWDAIAGKYKQTLEGHRLDVNSVAFSPDGRTIAGGGDDDNIHLWDAITGKHKQTLEGHTRNVNSVAFSPDGRTIVSGSSDDTLRIWDAITGKHMQTLEGHTDSVYSVAFSPNGRIVASGSNDDTLRIWRLSLPATSNATVRISATPVQSPTIGELLTLPLNITDGENIAGYQATASYDTSVLRYVSSKNGDYLPQGAFFVTPVVEGNTVTLAATSLTGESDGDGTLATLTFDLIAAKTSTLTLSKVSLVASDGTRSIPNVENTQIEIIEASRLIEDTNEDGVVNIQDLVLVASNFGKTGENAADANEDGVVDIVDLVLVAGALGNTASAPEVWHRYWEVAPTRTEVKQWLNQARHANLTTPAYQRGILVLEQLLAALTPKETALLPNYPNPFNPETWIPYQLAQPADVTLTIYAVDGTVIRTLALGHQSMGAYQGKSRAAYWDGRNALGEPVASGVYFYTLTAGEFTATQKMLIMK